MSDDDSFISIGKQSTNSKIEKKVKPAYQLRNQRITRRMKKIINSNSNFNTNATIANRKKQKCPICLNQCRDDYVSLPCSHTFCKGCIGNWWINHSTCPYCRTPFLYVLDAKKNKLSQEDVPAKQILQQEDTLKCQSCWADIDQEPMRICFDCRCVYNHKRCLTIQEIKMPKWRCEQCLDNFQKEIQQVFSKKESEQRNYYAPRNVKLQTANLEQRHSFRISRIKRND